MCQRLLGLLLLAVYSVTGTSAFSAVVAAAALAEGSHSVVVAQDATGTRVLLRHRSGAFTPKICDHRSSLARAVVTLCQKDAAGDHRFSAGHLSSNVSRECDGQGSSVKEIAAPSADLPQVSSWTAVAPSRRVVLHMHPLRPTSPSAKAMRLNLGRLLI
jgi:hypothetical protein